jgi:hypothetical protein
LDAQTAATEENQTETEEWIEDEEDLLASRSLPPRSVLIQWASLYDAEYAAKWPQKVFHEQVARPLNVTRAEEKQMEKGAMLDNEASEEGGDDVEGEGKFKEGEEKKQKRKEGDESKGEGGGEGEGEKKESKWGLSRFMKMPGLGRSSGEARQ